MIVGSDSLGTTHWLLVARPVEVVNGRRYFSAACGRRYFSAACGRDIDVSRVASSQAEVSCLGCAALLARECFSRDDRGAL